METRVSLEADYLTIQTFQAIHQLKLKEVQVMVKPRIPSNNKIYT